MMIGYLDRRVLVRTKHDLFLGRIIGEWLDKNLRGFIIETDGGRHFEIDRNRVVCFDDNYEIPFKEET